MKGMALNRAIYVFTVVTIVYTPLGFMAVSTSHLRINKVLKRLAGTMVIAHSEYSSRRPRYSSILGGLCHLFCYCADCNLHWLRVFDLVFHCNKKLEVFYQRLARLLLGFPWLAVPIRSEMDGQDQVSNQT